MAMNFVSLATYIVEWLIAFLYFGHIFEVKKSNIHTAIGGLVLYLIGAAQYILFYVPLLNTAVMLLINTIYAFTFFKTMRIKCLISIAAYGALGNISELIVIFALSTITGGAIDQYLSSLPLFIIAIAMSKTMLLLLSIFVAKFVFSRNTSVKTERTPAFLFIFPLSVLIIDFSLWNAAAESELSPKLKVLIVTGSSILLVSVLLTYLFYGKFMRKSQELFQLQSSFERSETEKEYYSILDHQNEELKTFIHDEKNHLTAIKSMADNPEIHKYIDSILGDLKHSSPLGNTKNKTLDLIIGKYNQLCDIKHIKFTYSTLNANLSFIDDSDLVSLMSNILDNAVAAAEKSDDKWIDMCIKRVGGVSMLSCKNSYAIAPIIQNGVLKTSKKNKKFHGIGIKSISRTAKKYNGHFEWSFDKNINVFSVDILFEE